MPSKKPVSPFVNPLHLTDEQRSEQMRNLLAIFKEAVGNEKPERTQEARLEMVETMVAQAYKRGAIVRAISKLFKVTHRTVDEDIKRAKDRFISYVENARDNEHLAESVARMDHAVHRALEAGDIHAAVYAAKHRDNLLGLTKNKVQVSNPDGSPIKVPAMELIIKEIIHTEADIRGPEKQGD